MTKSYDLNMEIVGQIIRKVRLERKLTQSQLGEMIGVKKSHISKLENGLNSPTINTISKVFNALNAEIKFEIELLNN